MKSQHISKKEHEQFYCLQLANIRHSIYTLQSYIPTEQIHPQSIYSLQSYIPTDQIIPHHFLLLETHEKGHTKIVNFQYFGEIFPFCSLKQWKIH